ncbi:MAG: 2-phosphosulfolactate phosphatase [Luteibaculaceae bacterium]
MDNRSRVEVCFSPDDFELYKDGHEIAVVIDVLRATSAICAAFNNGVEAIIPVKTIEEAWEYKNQGYLAGAERDGKIVEGFDFGNSPFAYMNPDFKGKTVVLSTTNGTRAIKIASELDTVVIGSLLNLDHLCNWLLEQGKNTLLICSGWKGKFNLEDTICAGAIAHKLLQTRDFKSEEDSSISAMFTYLSAKESYFGFLKASSHRRRLRALKLNKDIIYCLTPNQTAVLPILKDGKLINLG